MNVEVALKSNNNAALFDIKAPVHREAGFPNVDIQTTLPLIDEPFIYEARV